MKRDVMLLVAPGPYRGGLFRCAQLVVGGIDWAPQVQGCLERGRVPVVAGGSAGWFRRAGRKLAGELQAAVGSLQPVVGPGVEPGQLWLFGVSLVAGAEKVAGEAAAGLDEWLVRLYPIVGRMVDLAGRDEQEVQLAAAEARLLLDGLRADTDRLLGGTAPDQPVPPPLIGA